MYNHLCKMINLSTYSWGVWFCNAKSDDHVQDWLSTNIFGIVGMSIKEFFMKGEFIIKRY